MKKLLVIHGGPGMSNDYILPYLNSLEKDFDVVGFAYDLIESPTLDKVVDQLQELLEQINLNETTILAHSFGSIIVLYHYRKYKIEFSRYIFANWIYDNSWLDMFLNNNRAFLEQRYFSTGTLKERMHSIIPLYFDSEALGERVLNETRYNDLGFNNLSLEAKALNFEHEIGLLAKNIFSIFSKNDRVVDCSYMEKIALKFNIQKFCLNTGAHFPYLDLKSGFFEKIEAFLHMKEIS